MEIPIWLGEIPYIVNVIGYNPCSLPRICAESRRRLKPSDYDWQLLDAWGDPDPEKEALLTEEQVKKIEAKILRRQSCF